jgi:hypothetical protein
MEPFRRVSFFKRDILQRYGKVDEVKIQVVEAKVVQGPLTGSPNVLGLVERIPQFAGDPQVLSFDQTSGYGILNALANLGIGF